MPRFSRSDRKQSRICFCRQTSTADSGSSAINSFGCEQQRAGDDDTLRLASAQICRAALQQQFIKRDIGKDGPDQRGSLVVAVTAMDLQHLVQLRPDLHQRIERILWMLKHHLGADLTRQRERARRDSNLPGIRTHKAYRHLGSGCLAAAAFTNQRDDFALCNGEANSVCSDNRFGCTPCTEDSMAAKRLADIVEGEANRTVFLSRRSSMRPCHHSGIE